MAKKAFKRKRCILCSTMNFDPEKGLVKCFVWSILLYGSKTWTMRSIDRNELRLWKCRLKAGINWMDKISYEDVLGKIK